MSYIFQDDLDQEIYELDRRRPNDSVIEQQESKRRHRAGVDQDDRQPFVTQQCGGGRRVIRKRIGGD